MRVFLVVVMFQALGHTRQDTRRGLLSRSGGAGGAGINWHRLARRFTTARTLMLFLNTSKERLALPSMDDPSQIDRRR